MSVLFPGLMQKFVGSFKVSVLFHCYLMLVCLHRFSLQCCRSEYVDYYDSVTKFITIQGRMKFVRPIYQYVSDLVLVYVCYARVLRMPSIYSFYSFIHSFIHLFIHSFIHLFIYSFFHLFIYS